MERFKFKHLNEPYFKSGTGLEIALPLALSGAGIAASVYSSSRANSMQQAMSEKAMDWQSEEAEKAREYNTQERQAAQAYQSGQLNNLMRFQEQMQSPVYQSQQLRSAGINPAVYFSQHGTFSGGSAPSAPSAPQGAYSPMPSASPSIHPVVPDWASSMAIGANISKTLAESGHSKADTDLILQKVYGEELVNQGRDFELSLKKLKAPADVMRAYQDVMVLQAQEFMLVQQGKEFEKRADLNAAQAKIQEFLGNKASAEAAYAQEQMNDLIQTRNARLGLLKSESNKNNAQATEARYSAEQLHESAEDMRTFRGYRSELLRLQKEEQDSKNTWNTETWQRRLAQLDNQLNWSQVKLLETKIELYDKRAYNALQRLLRGHGNKSDMGIVLDALNNLDLGEDTVDSR